MNYGEKVKYARKKVGKSAADLADFIGVSQPMISKVENNISELSPDNTKKMAEFLEVPLEFFLNDDVVTLEELTMSESAKEILSDSSNVNYVVLAGKAKESGLTPEELEKAILFAA